MSKIIFFNIINTLFDDRLREVIILMRVIQYTGCIINNLTIPGHLIFVWSSPSVHLHDRHLLGLSRNVLKFKSSNCNVCIPE